MVLINALDETVEALYGEDNGNYLEERIILKQMGKYLDINSLYEPLKNHLKSGVDKELLIPKLKTKYSNALWISVLEKLYNIIPDKQMAESFRQTFEYNKKQEKNNRLSILQKYNITYFIEDLNQKLVIGTYDEAYANLLIKEFEDWLIMTGSFVLDDPDMNLELDESVEFFKTKVDEFKTQTKSKNVK